MDFKKSLEGLQEGQDLSYEDACIWAGALYNDWTDAPTKHALGKKIMDEMTHHLKDLGPDSSSPAKELMLRYTPEDTEQPAPDYAAVFDDDHAFLEFALMTYALEYKRKTESEKHELDCRLAVKTGMTPNQAELAEHYLKIAVAEDRIKPQSEARRVLDEVRVFFGSDKSPDAARRLLYTEAYGALFDGGSPFKVLQELSPQAKKSYEAELEEKRTSDEHLTQGRSNKVFAEAVQEMTVVPQNSWEKLTQGRYVTDPNNKP